VNDGSGHGCYTITHRNCSFDHVFDAVNANLASDGVVVMDNTDTKRTGLRAYFPWVPGADQVYVGNTVPDSIRSHVLRMAGADRVLIANNDFTNLPNPDGALRGTLTLHKGHYIYVTGNKLTG